jgi:hypothetical protein
MFITHSQRGVSLRHTIPESERRTCDHAIFVDAKQAIRHRKLNLAYDALRER